VAKLNFIEKMFAAIDVAIRAYDFDVLDFSAIRAIAR
jgi:hypothetical protein